MDIRVPQLAEGSDVATVVSVLVKEGEAVKKDQAVLELETSKAVGSVPSPAAGVIKRILVKDGQEVKLGQVLISLDAGDTNGAKEAAPEPRADASASPTPASGARPSAKSAFGAMASPSLRKSAFELGLDLEQVPGSERGGRLNVGDVQNYVRHLQSGGAAKAPVSIDFSKWGTVNKKPLSSLRKTIAARMSESWNSIPHVTQFDEADITALLALYKKYAPAYDKKNARLTLTSLIIKAVAASLKRHPTVNSSLDEATQELVLKDYVHIGVAVDTEHGLIVPVLRDADKKDVLAISVELQELAEKTRQRKVSADDLQGGSFTISNLGGIGGTFFTPIVNKPQVAILGVGRGRKVPVMQDGKWVERVMLPLGLSYDHRVVDGADGARFITDFRKELENLSDDVLSKPLSGEPKKTAKPAKVVAKAGKRR